MKIMGAMELLIVLFLELSKIFKKIQKVLSFKALWAPVIFILGKLYM